VVHEIDAAEGVVGFKLRDGGFSGTIEARLTIAGSGRRSRLKRRGRLSEMARGEDEEAKRNERATLKLSVI
jgi:hypothetical protein